MKRDPLTERIIGCAIEVHRSLGSGLLESADEKCLAHELAMPQIIHQTQLPIPIEYKGIRLDCGYRICILNDGKVIVDLKSVEKITGVHEAQMLTYMRLAKVEIGLLINFNVRRLVGGMKRYRL